MEYNNLPINELIPVYHTIPENIHILNLFNTTILKEYFCYYLTTYILKKNKTIPIQLNTEDYINTKFTNKFYNIIFKIPFNEIKIYYNYKNKLNKIKKEKRIPLNNNIINNLKENKTLVSLNLKPEDIINKSLYGCFISNYNKSNIFAIEIRCLSNNKKYSKLIKLDFC